MKRTLFVILSLLILSSCAAYKGVNLFSLKIGMTKSEVVNSVGKNPDNLIGAKQYEDGTMEVIQYSKYNAWTGMLEERYWLYFFNDYVLQWGRPGDWQREADRIYEIRER